LNKTMKTILKTNLIQNLTRLTVARKPFLVLALVGAAVSLQAQGIIANGQISGVSVGAGTFDYTLTIGEGSATTTPIASIWYAWIPGGFFLPSDPASATAPAGWTATIVDNSIQFQSSSAAFDIAPGSSLTFSYVAGFSPAQLAAASNSGLSFAYAGAVDASSPNEEFTVQAVPEPSALNLLLSGSVGLCLVGWRKLRSAQS
jgi:hypothetical protein